VRRLAILALPLLAAAPAAAQEAPPAQPPAAPAWSGDYAADRAYDPAVMAHARMMAKAEMGAMAFSKVALKLGEFQSGADGGGYRWDGEAWYGGDINRLAIRTEGEGKAKGGLDAGEVQLLYGRAVSPNFDVQAGVRQDFAPYGRTYLTVGTQGVLPYWVELDGAVFLSAKGQVLGRAEAAYELRLLQKVVLQPRVELNIAGRDAPESRIGSGLSNAEVGVRLRYEIRREFAPYIGVSWDRRFGRTAAFVRAAGEDPRSTTFVVGLAGWF
jgi:copper resistance protein B